MKRSRSIRLVLISGLSAGAVTSCGPADFRKTPLSAETVYTNNFFVPGVGYYHAPFRAWYPRPYNDFDPQTGRYFYGGQWGTSPCQSITNISTPTTAAVQGAQALRTDVRRGGFGGTSHSHSLWS